MSVQESAKQKIFNNSIYHGCLRFIAESRLRSGTRDFKGWVRNVVCQRSLYDEAPDQGSKTDLTVSNREVYLEGYKSHEEVVRAYLEFSGIDPDSKEGRVYFEL